MRAERRSPHRPWGGWVALREAFLDRVAGVRPGDVLNPAVYGLDPVPALAVAAGLKRVGNRLKAEAVDASGRRVDYRKLRASPAYAELRAVWTPRLCGLEPERLETREERTAFWINVYNTLVIDAVIAFGLERARARGWLELLRFFRRAAYRIGRHRYSLEDIEHGLLRANRGSPFLPGPQFGPGDPRRRYALEAVDPRVHFALSCGSRSCPPIGVYDPAGLDAQLDVAAASFVREEVRLDPGRRRVLLSPLFRWYLGDFGGRAGLVRFLLRYLPEGEARDWFARNHPRLRWRFTRYDWGVNVWGAAEPVA